MKQITPEQIAQFDGYIVKWQGLLNLNDWRLIRSPKLAKGSCAEVSASAVDRTAVYRIGNHFGLEEMTDQTLEGTAIHELLHVLLTEYRDMCLLKQSEDAIMGAEHRIVQTLERLLTPKSLHMENHV